MTDRQQEGMTRRTFVQTSAMGVAVAPMIVNASVFGANDRLQIGIVGPGGRGGSLMNDCWRVQGDYNAELVAVADLWKQRREDVAGRMRDKIGKEPKVYDGLDAICQDKSIDALIIATGDFLHAPHCAQAVQAGKDVFVEKPLGCDFEQIKRCRDIVNASDRVVQTGTQRRSSGKFYDVRDYVQSGALGAITYGEISEPLWQPRWRIEGSETRIAEKDTDWKTWQNYTYDPARPFSSRQYLEFRIFWPFSTGCFCQWMSHQIDIVNLVLDELPESVVADGGLFLWKDGRTNPDTCTALVKYPSGCLVSYHMRMGNNQNGRGTTLYGTLGTLDVNGAKAWGGGGKAEVTWSETDTDHPKPSYDESGRLPDEAIEIAGKHESYDHMGYWLDCVRNRRRPRADIDAAFGNALATTMAGMSYREGRKVLYNAETDEISLA